MNECNFVKLTIYQIKDWDTFQYAMRKLLR